MTTYPYELLTRFNKDGTVAGAHTRTLTVSANGRESEDDPVPLSSATHPAFSAYKEQFAASAVAERDALRTEREQLSTEKQSLESQLAAVTAERDQFSESLSTVAAENAALISQVEQLQSANASLAARVEELQSQLDAIQNPPVNPRHLAPFDFLALLKAEEIYGMQTSVDPTVVVGRSKLQTIITYVDLDNPETIGLVQYMEQVGIAAAGRAAQILAGQAWQ